LQSIKLLKVQAKEREAAEEYEKELEKIIQRADKVDKTTKEYTEEQNKTISLIDEKEALLKSSAKSFQGMFWIHTLSDEAEREKQEHKKIEEIAKEIENIKKENAGLK